MIGSILICDDSNIARKQLRKVLPDAWQDKVTFANNGQEAIDLLREQHFDLLFLDLTMPVLNGFDTLTLIKSEGISIKTIVVSADFQTEAQKKVTADGAMDFIRKPASVETIHNVLTKHKLL